MLDIIETEELDRKQKEQLDFFNNITKSLQTKYSCKLKRIKSSRSTHPLDKGIEVLALNNTLFPGIIAHMSYGCDGPSMEVGVDQGVLPKSVLMRIPGISRSTTHGGLGFKILLGYTTDIPPIVNTIGDIVKSIELAIRNNEMPAGRLKLSGIRIKPKTLKLAR